MKRLLARLELIEATGVLEVDVDWINGNYQRILFHSVRTASADRVRRMATPRRHLALVCFLHQAWRDTLDQAVDMYGKLLDPQSEAGSTTVSATCSRRSATPSTGSFSLEGVADNRQVAFDDDGWRLEDGPGRAARPGAGPTASPSCTAGWTPAAARSGWPTCSSRSRTTSGSAATSSSPARSRSTPARSAPCSPRSSPMAATSASTPWRRSHPTSPTEGSSTSATGASSRRTSAPHSPPSSTGISRLDAASHWGDGTTSASDGQRFAMPQKVLQRTYSLLRHVSPIEWKNVVLYGESSRSTPPSSRGDALSVYQRTNVVGTRGVCARALCFGSVLRHEAGASPA